MRKVSVCVFDNHFMIFFTQIFILSLVTISLHLHFLLSLKKKQKLSTR